ncbi:MAG TPA: transcription antitermination factor NusB [Atribacteraceae bacterium]|nr:transcription antitermination factor NusB [Atribacteraceae bacterium]
MRRQVREKALQVLYQKDLLDVPLREIFLRMDLPEIWSEDDRSFFYRLTSGVADQLTSIDRILTAYTEGWTLPRMPAIDRNILRIAVFEIFFLPEISLKVAINEAVILGKKFGSEDSGRFINGVLGRVARTTMHEERETLRDKTGEEDVHH